MVALPAKPESRGRRLNEYQPVAADAELDPIRT
jgi:hypothetical protein